MTSRAETIYLRHKPKSNFEVSSLISLRNPYVFVPVSKSASGSVKWLSKHSRLS